MPDLLVDRPPAAAAGATGPAHAGRAIVPAARRSVTAGPAWASSRRDARGAGWDDGAMTVDAEPLPDPAARSAVPPPDEGHRQRPSSPAFRAFIAADWA